MGVIDYEHKMAAHCETGTVAGILNHAGMKISEPMVLGISAGIFFAYLESKKFPFPTFVHRSKPGSIRKRIKKQLKIPFKEKKFRSSQKAADALDKILEKKIPAAVQVDMFYMDYIPKYMRVHFNGHFVAVTGKEGDVYSISDCYYPQVGKVSTETLKRARSANGDLAPKGLLFYTEDVDTGVDLKMPVIRGIKSAACTMVKLPVPFIGVKGIRLFAKKVVDWPAIARDETQLTHEVMDISANLEEKGTGGAGFRFMYASFLQEASRLLDNDELALLSEKMMKNGDRWREISLFAARMGKNRDFTSEKFRELQDLIYQRADNEQELFTQLLKAVK